MSLNTQRTVYLLFVAALGCGFWLLSAGTSGGFLFDDYNNLQGLAALNQQPGLQNTMAYVFNGLSSTLGRPLSLASFAAQHSDWPANPAAFKAVNILIHLINGALLFLVLRQLDRLRQKRPALLWLPLCAASLWLLHPLQVSTVLYVVQRMTELSALFVLLGVLLYLLGRTAGSRENSRRAWVLMSLGICIGLGPGVLSKENAALMPLLVLVLEYTLLAKVPPPPAWKIWRALFLLTPSLLLIGYLLLQYRGFSNMYAIRDFTLTERLLTETRVLFDYLGKILLPTPSAFGLLFDDFPLSRSLFRPLSTVFAVTGIAALAVTGFALRHRQPVLAFAILWFFTAHLLESTVIPMEIYYEHRNYLAAIGPLYALAHYTIELLRRLDRRLLKVTLAAGFAAYSALLVFITHQEARLWGDPLLQAATWAQSHPDSRRLTYLFADELLKRGNAGKAAQLYRAAASKWPESAVPLVAAMEASCFLPRSSDTDIEETSRRLSTQQGEENETILFLSRLVNVHSGGDCPTLATSELLDLLDAAWDNPYRHHQRVLVLTMKAQLYEANGRLLEAAEAHAAAFKISPTLQAALDGAALYARHGQPERGRQFLLSALEHPRLDWRDKLTMSPQVEALLAQLDRLEQQLRSRQ